MEAAAITLSGVCKRYRVFASQRERLLHALSPGRTGGVDEIRALEAVGFEIRRGESVAVIGRNGSGKSTLLSILAGTLQPTAGTVKVNGRVSALLELGSGFDPEYTGRENVVLNGLLLGLAREEIVARFDEIADFAEIGDAMERPVKTYSNGMMMRLAFAVQVLADPEILLIDEALSVGDIFFQQKCFARIRALSERGVTLLFVSHDMGAVRDLCARAVYLKDGAVAYFGDSTVAIRHYFSEARTVPAQSAAASEATPAPGELPGKAAWKRSPQSLPGPLLAVEVTTPQGQPIEHARLGETIRVRAHFRASPGHGGHLSLVMKNRYDQVVSCLRSQTGGRHPLDSGEGGQAVFEWTVGLMVEAGAYTFMVSFARPTGANRGDLIEDTGWFGPFQVDWDYENEAAPFLGMFGLPASARLLDETGREKMQP